MHVITVDCIVFCSKENMIHIGSNNAKGKLKTAVLHKFKVLCDVKHANNPMNCLLVMLYAIHVCTDYCCTGLYYYVSVCRTFCFLRSMRRINVHLFWYGTTVYEIADTNMKNAVLLREFDKASANELMMLLLISGRVCWIMYKKLSLISGKLHHWFIAVKHLWLCVFFTCYRWWFNRNY